MSLHNKPIVVDPSGLARIATVDPRFQSFNVEMVEVTGGRFWAPYSAEPEPEDAEGGVPGVAGDGTSFGDDARNLFRHRPPIDLGNARLRELAGALAPAYMRVSGSWANFTYFHDSDQPVSRGDTDGFQGTLTREQWQGVVQFSKDLGLDLLLSFAVSEGVRDEKGVWQPDQARALFEATARAGGRIAAVEFMNESTVGRMQGLPSDYGPADYARDFALFKALVRDISPDTIIAGPSAVAERSGFDLPGMGDMIRTEDIYAITGPSVDAMSYHYYGGLSRRCASGLGLPIPQISQALTPDWLAGTGLDADFYGELRDRFEPGKPLWLTETAECACGGNPWAAYFIDTFRYVDQLGRLARRSVQTVMHNTLAASDYSLLDEDSFEPRPSYWAALLWRRLMGDVVLDAGEPDDSSTYVYAHDLRGVPAGVAAVALNTDRERSAELQIPGVEQSYCLHAEGSLQTTSILLNGKPLELGADGHLPELQPETVPSGTVTVPPASISFLVAPGAGIRASLIHGGPVSNAAPHAHSMRAQRKGDPT